MPPELENTEVETTNDDTSSSEPDGYAENLPEGGEAQTDGAAIDAEAEAAAEGSPEPGERREVTDEVEVDGGEGEYAPNLKYKVSTVGGGKQEKDFPEWTHGLVNKENEKEFRDILTKVDGFDMLKHNHGELRNRAEQIGGAYEQLATTYNEHVSHLKNGDMDGFFDSIKLDPEKVMAWAVQRAKIKQLPPEQQELYNKQQETRRENLRLQRENSGYQMRTSQTETQAMALSLDTALSAPQHSPIAQEFDQSQGKLGAFRDLVIRNAVLEEQMTKKKVSVDHAIASTLRMLGKAPAAPSQGAKPKPGSPAPRQGAGQKVITQGKKPTVIPHVPSANASPVAKAPRSVEDLRKISAGFASKNA